MGPDTHAPVPLTDADAAVLRQAQAILAARAKEWRQRHLANGQTGHESCVAQGLSLDAEIAAFHITKLLKGEG